jgi:hypothetical protein
VSSSFADIVEDIRKERTAQDREHGGPAHDDALSQWQWVALLTRHRSGGVRRLPAGEHRPLSPADALCCGPGNRGY